jgi:hypothetical protein
VGGEVALNEMPMRRYNETPRYPLHLHLTLMVNAVDR